MVLLLLVIMFRVSIVCGCFNVVEGWNLWWYIVSVLFIMFGVKCEVNVYGSFIEVVMCVLNWFELRI